MNLSLFKEVNKYGKRIFMYTTLVLFLFFVYANIPFTERLSKPKYLQK